MQSVVWRPTRDRHLTLREEPHRPKSIWRFTLLVNMNSEGETVASTENSASVIKTETVARNLENSADVADAAGVPGFDGDILREAAVVLREATEDFRRKFGEDC